jgi:thymidylate synthase|tara:strand:- start:3468 stop:4520 length:1053 start_codon:yes stop_codon:yes gene_type:complete
MIVIDVPTVHKALPLGIHLLQQDGVHRMSRNGPVIACPHPVTTVYNDPRQKCVMWVERDTNIAFLLYESLWMLSGKRTVEPLTRYVKNFARYSDDKKYLHGAYGYRWREAFGVDQLSIIQKRLIADPEDRRCVLQMWDCQQDLDSQSLDVPCNDIATFQIDHEGKLNLVVFCRSNDVIWGAYFANAFHFGMLLEYMAAHIRCEVGTYTQVSVNFHAYLDTLGPLLTLGEMCPFNEETFTNQVESKLRLEYGESLCGKALEIPTPEELLDEHISEILMHADTGFILPRVYTNEHPWVEAIYAVLKAHHIWRMDKTPLGVTKAIGVLDFADSEVDWVILMKRWLRNRRKNEI